MSKRRKRPSNQGSNQKPNSKVNPQTSADLTQPSPNAQPQHGQEAAKEYKPLSRDEFLANSSGSSARKPLSKDDFLKSSPRPGVFSWITTARISAAAALAGIAMTVAFRVMAENPKVTANKIQLNTVYSLYEDCRMQLKALLLGNGRVATTDFDLAEPLLHKQMHECDKHFKGQCFDQLEDIKSEINDCETLVKSGFDKQSDLLERESDFRQFEKRVRDKFKELEVFAESYNE